VVQTAKLARPLDRDEIDRLLDDADQRVVAARVAADGTSVLLGQISAFVAEANSLLHSLDGSGQGERLLLGSLQEMESEPMSSAAANPW